MPIVRKADATHDTGTAAQVARLGPFEDVLYSDAGGLMQFGAFVETLAPGSRSSDRHWHELEDEFLYMLTGTATLVENDGPHPLMPGDVVCWPAGVANGHHVLNEGDTPCSFLIVGTRSPSDRVHYSDVDRLLTRDRGITVRTRRDGSPLDEEPVA